MVGLCSRAFRCRGACLAFCAILSIWLCRLVYAMSCVCVCVCVCVLCVGCCVSSYRWAGCVSRSGLMGVVEKVRFSDLHPSVVFGLTWGVRLFFLLWVCILCVYCDKAVGPM